MPDPRADQIRTGYAPVARAYREQLGDELAGKPLDRAFLDAFAERCATGPSAGGTILDVGCGPGHVARYLANRLAGRGATVEGLDLSPEMIAEARAAYPGLAFAVGDMYELPARGFAGIVAFYAIVHAASDALPFAAFHRALAPGGLAAIAFHASAEPETVHVDELFGQRTALDFVFHRPEAVIAALEAARFTLEARLDRAPYPGVEHPSRRTYLLARR